MTIADTFSAAAAFCASASAATDETFRKSRRDVLEFTAGCYAIPGNLPTAALRKCDCRPRTAAYAAAVFRTTMKQVRRRSFLGQVIGGIGVAAAGAATRARGAERSAEQPYTNPLPRTQGRPPQFKTKLRITKLETFLVKPRWLFLKVHTDAGIVGLGEPIVEGRAKTCAAAVAEIAPDLIGKDPRNVVHHWQAIYRHAFYRGGPILTSALSGIEQALWDIKGKFLGVPVYELLGGPTRDRVRVYAHVANTPERLKQRDRKSVV